MLPRTDRRLDDFLASPQADDWRERLAAAFFDADGRTVRRPAAGRAGTRRRFASRRLARQRGRGMAQRSSLFAVLTHGQRERSRNTIQAGAQTKRSAAGPAEQTSYHGAP